LPGGAQSLRALRIDYDQDFFGFDEDRAKARDKSLEDSFHS